MTLCLLVLARDEAGVLPATLHELRRQAVEDVELHVVADHCRDLTEPVARALGARVHVRRQGAPGKGPALRWWLDQTREEGSPDDWIVVLDADTRPSPDLVSRLSALLAASTPGANLRGAYQILVQPEVTSPGHLPRLAAHAEIVEQRLHDRLRAALGWPVRLRGTGMALRRGELESVAGELRTSIEDVELTLLLVHRRLLIEPIFETYVIDPKPDGAGAVRQRARWLKGQAEVFRVHAGLTLKLALRGPAGWSAIGSTLIKPRTLLFPLKLGLAAVLWALALSAPGLWATAIAASVSLWAAVDVLAMLIGLRYASDPWATLLSLFLSPLYFIMWLRSFGLALTSRERWLRARPSGDLRASTEFQRTSP